MGIQNRFRKAITIIVHIQDGNQFTIHRIGIPASKLVAFTGSGSQELCRQPGIIALNIIAYQLAAIGIILHIGNMRGRIHSVIIIHEHIGLRQPAAQMADGTLAPGKGIQHKGIDDRIGILGIAQGCDQRFSRTQVSRAHIVAHGEQTIKLVLGVCKAVLINKPIDRLFKSHRHLAQLSFRLLLGHGVLHIILNLVLGAFRAVADGISAIGLNIGLTTEILVEFYESKASITDLHIRSRTSHRCHHQQSQEQTNRQTQTCKSFKHGSFSFSANFD